MASISFPQIEHFMVFHLLSFEDFSKQLPCQPARCPPCDPLPDPALPGRLEVADEPGQEIQKRSET
jgi:hypothetical protein